MTTERWGAFSVIDHQDAAKLACDVLLYDRLVFPVPREAMLAKWEGRGWDPSGRLRQLGPLAIQAVWTEAHHDAVTEMLRQITEDARGEVEAGLRWEATRRVLVMGKDNYALPEGVDAIEVLSAFQSEDQARPPNQPAPPVASPPLQAGIARMNSLIAARLLVPHEADPEDSLKRALDMVDETGFREARLDFFHWQEDMLRTGLSPEQASDRLEAAIRRYNSFVRESGREFRVETIVLTTVVAATLTGAVASVAPGLFAPLAAFGLAGGSVVTLGSAAAGAVAQIAQHAVGATAPAAPPEKAAAMFHQIEKDLGWHRRSAGLGAA